MSEYQWHEFLAIDQPLSAKQMTALRKISTRAEISSTRFWNEYQWGDLKADPAKLVERYFDAYLYFANWGTQRLMLRMPKARLDAKALQPYLRSQHATRLVSTSEHLVLDFISEMEEPESYDESPTGVLATLARLRDELMRGDLRAAYLAWLLAVQADDVDDDLKEPPVPPGLAALTTAQEQMVEFLRIDIDLLAAAALGSTRATDDDKRFRQWVAQLSAKEKDTWLRRAAEDPQLAVGGELLRAFRATAKEPRAVTLRTVAELRMLAEAQAELREHAKAGRAKKAKVAAEAALQRRLAKLRGDVDAAWTKLEKLVASSSYEPAMALALDLQALATRDGEAAAFATCFEAMRKRLFRRLGFFSRWTHLREPK